MQWSKLKKRVEHRFSPKVGRRVSVHFTTYRRPFLIRHGRGWVALDKEEILTASVDEYDRGVTRHGGTAGDEYFALEPTLASEGYFSESSFLESLHRFLSSSIEDSLASTNVLIRGLAILDSRVGKRRLLTFEPNGEHPFVSRLMRLRFETDQVLAKLKAPSN